MKNTTTIDPNSISNTELYQILSTAVAPRPIALASTIDQNGNINLSPFSFFNVFSTNPPILIFSPVRKGSDNTIKHTHENAKEVKEVVINIVNYDIVAQMSLSSTGYDKEIDEFIKSGLTPIPSEKIKPPRVGEAPVSFECVIDNIIELGTEGGAGNLVISRVINIHINDDYKGIDGKLDTKKLDLVARMGGNWYTRANENSLFEIPKPIHTKGIGVDSLPLHAINSKILTGNDLGKLGNIAQKPDIISINKCKSDKKIETILKISNTEIRFEEIHKIVKKQLENNNLTEALSILFCV